jgi:hypothetical protein
MACDLAPTGAGLIPDSESSAIAPMTVVVAARRHVRENQMRSVHAIRRVTTGAAENTRRRKPSDGSGHAF